MTDQEGRILPQCAAQLAILETTGRQMNKAFGEMQQEFKIMTRDIQSQQIAVGRLTDGVDKLSISVEKLNGNLDERLRIHEESCLIRKIVNKRAEKDITEKLHFSRSSNPPKTKEEVEDDEIAKSIRKLPKKIQIIVGIIISAGIITSGIITFLTSV